jgi:hypothetical protein
MPTKSIETPPPQNAGRRRGFKNRLANLGRAMAPSRAAWRGATVAVLLVTAVIWISIDLDLISGASTIGPVFLGTTIALASMLLARACCCCSAGPFAKLRCTFAGSRWAAYRC